MCGHLRDAVFGAINLDALAELREGVRKRRFRHPQAESGGLHKAAHLDLLLALHPADENKQGKPLPSRTHAMFGE